MRSIAVLFVATLLVLVTALSAGAQPVAAGLIMTDPTQMQCKYISNPGFAACNIEYEGALIYEGPTRGPAEAGADCTVCRSFKTAAIKQNKHIYLDRALSWDFDGFLSLTDDDVPTPACYGPQAQ